MDKSIFNIRSGWLSYAPFRHYQLPKLVYVTEREVVGAEGRPSQDVNVVYGDEKRVTVPFVNKAGNVMFTRPLFRLQWPGELPETGATGGIDMVPASILKNIPGHEPLADFVNEWFSLWDVVTDVDRNPGAVPPPVPLPQELPPILAYHLAVNRELYYKDQSIHHPVAALSEHRVSQVIDARFAIDANYMAALKYLKWHAESHHQHPMFNGFDTNVCETLMALSHKSAELYFYMLADCMYDQRKHYWARDNVWHRLALYLHYVGRTGQLLYARLAGIDPPSGIRSDVVTEQMQDVLDRVLEWHDDLSETARQMSHEGVDDDVHSAGPLDC